MDGFVLFLFSNKLLLQAQAEIEVVGYLLLKLGNLVVFLLNLEFVVLDQLQGLVVLGGVGFPALELFKILNHLLPLSIVHVELCIESLG